MNNSKKKAKGKTLFVVEGEFEDKNLNYLCDLYPELRISEQSIIIFRTNIYNLYFKIIEEYGDDWYSLDVDIPYLVTRNTSEKMFKNNFVNIYLFFDFERQDPFYEDEKIIKMQEKFNDPTDNGKLYINYPMIEAFLDFSNFPDSQYCSRKMNMIDYKKYKQEVYTKSKLWEDINNFYQIEELLKKINKKITRENVWQIIENYEKVDVILNELGYIKNKKNINRIFNLKKIVGKYKCNSYKEKMKILFNYCVKKTIKKSLLIQNEFVDKNEYLYDDISLNKILYEQIKLYNEDKEIFILGTWILMVPEYNPKLID